MSDATITPPPADAAAEGDSPGDDTENTVASVRVHEADGWHERRLGPADAMEITLSDGSTVAIVEIDGDIVGSGD